MASEAPAKRSGRLSTNQRDPCTMPASSSGKNTTMTSRRGRSPVRPQWRTTAVIIASMFFMSTAPRPQMKPSSTSAANGGWVQSLATAGTTSKCPCTTTAGALGSTPGIRKATPRRRSLPVTMTSGSHPVSRSRSAQYSAASASPTVRGSGPQLLVSIRIRSRVMATASPSISDEKDSPGAVDTLPSCRVGGRGRRDMLCPA